MIKKILKWAAIAIGALIAIVFVVGWAMNEKLPESTTGPEAEMLADKMMEAVNCAAWDTVGAVSWDFGGRQQHIWDKKRHYAQVKWGEDMKALIDINKKSGKAYKAGQELLGEAAKEAVIQAWKFWVNDAFWLNAPCKVKDGGTTRSWVELENGKKGLLVSYATGGATPGDKYLWELDESGKPTAYSMWVSIIPIGGVSFTWEGWENHEGAQLSSIHKGLFTLVLDGIETATSPAELNGGIDPFAALD